MKGIGARALIQFADEHYFLRPELKVWTDAEAFMEEIAHAQAMAKNGDQACAIAHNEVAAALYRADFLEEDRYEEWTISPRQRLRTAYTALLVDLGRLHFDAGNFEAALDHSRKLIERDCCCEDAHFQIMRCYSALGQRVLAAQHYLVSRETLARELGVRPMDAMTRLYEEITAADHNGRAT